jgi:hypothetical protein
MFHDVHGFRHWWVEPIDGFGPSHENWGCSGCLEGFYPNQKRS